MTKTKAMREKYRNKAVVSALGLIAALLVFAKQIFNYGSAMTVAYADELAQKKIK